MDNLLQLGAVAVIFLFAVKEFFSYLKSKKENGGAGLNGAILKELQIMNNNHLNSLKEAIVDGNRQLVDVIHANNIIMIEILGEIKGRLK